MKHIFKKALSVLITLCLVFTLLPATVFAEGTTYDVETKEDLKNAISNAVSGDTISINADITLTETLLITNENIILTSNGGYTLDASENMIFIYTPGEVTLDGSLKVTGSSNPVIMVREGSLTLAGNATVEQTDPVDQIKPAIRNDNGTINVNGGTVKSRGDGIANNSGTLTVNGGTVEGSNNAIYVPGGTLTVNGGTIGSPTLGLRSRYGIYVADATANIDGGNIHGSVNAVHIAGGATLNMTGGTATIDTGAYYVLQCLGTAILSGGSFPGGRLGTANNGSIHVDFSGSNALTVSDDGMEYVDNGIPYDYLTDLPVVPGGVTVGQQSAISLTGVGTGVTVALDGSSDKLAAALTGSSVSMTPAAAGKYKLVLTFSAASGTDTQSIKLTLPVTVAPAALTPLATPAGPGWDAATPGKAKWSAVDHASGYRVQLYKDGAEVKSINPADTEFDFTETITANGSGNYTFKVTASGDYEIYSDSQPSVVSPTYLYSSAPSDDVCKIGLKGYTSLDAAIADVPAGGAQHTITLMQNITHTSPVVIDGKKIYFDLNGFDLTIDTRTTNYSTALKATNVSDVIFNNDGKLNIRGSRYGVYAYGYSHISLAGDVAATGGIHPDSGAYPGTGVYVSDNSTVTIDGSVTGDILAEVNGIPMGPEDGINDPTKPGYIKYTQNSNSAVWVAATSASVWPAGSSLTASGTTDTGTVLTWTSATGAVRYSIYKNNLYVTEMPASDRTYAVTGLSPDTEYTFKVQAAYYDQASGINQWTTDGPSVTVRTAQTPPVNLDLSWSAASSTDGAIAGSISHVTAGDGGKLVAINGSGKLIISEDNGRNWSIVDTHSFVPRDVSYDGSAFIAGGNGLMKSDDGINWTNVTVNGLTNWAGYEVYALTTAQTSVGTISIANGTNGLIMATNSYDGSWMKLTTNTTANFTKKFSYVPEHSYDAGSGTYNLMQEKFAGLGGNSIYTISRIGSETTFRDVSPYSDTTVQNFSNVWYESAWNGTVITGYFYATRPNGGQTDLLISNNGKTGWYLSNTYSSLNGYAGYAENNAGTLVKVGNGGTVLTSSYGTSWSVQTVGTYDLNDVIYADGMFVAVGDHGVILTSADGLAWSVSVSNTTADLFDIVYAGGDFIAAGNGVILRTGDAAPVTTYTITFNNNGSVYAAKTVNTGDSIGSAAWPADPTRSGYTFGGWFTGVNGSGSVFTSATPVSATMDVYAKWTAIPPSISPASVHYDLNASADVITTITWNSAASVTDVVYGTDHLTTPNAFTVNGDILSIKDSYLSGLVLSEGDTLDFDISFDTGVTASLTVSVVKDYTPSGDAALSDLKVGGVTVSGFSAGVISYDMELPYGTSPGSAAARVSATASDPDAKVSITQASAIPGSATVVVTAEDNTTTKTYTINFTLGAESTTCTVTFNSNGSTYAVKTVQAGESIGSANWPAIPTRSGYTFRGWFTGVNGSGSAFTSAMPVNATMTVYAKWTEVNDGSTGGGGGSHSSESRSSTPATTPTYNADVKTGNSHETKLPVTVDKGTGTASIDIGSQKLTSGWTVITIPAIPGIDTYSIGITVPELSTADGQGKLTLNTDNGSITVPTNMLTGVSGITGSKAQISIGQGNKGNLPNDVKAAIGDRPMIQLTLSIDGKQTNWSNPAAPVTVSIPYTPTAAELANPESIVVWYIDGSGKVVTIPNGHYDPTARTVTVDVTHFSGYAAAYNKVSFNDVASGAWYNKAVSFIAARGVTTGTEDVDFRPDAKLARGEYIVMLMKAYGIAPDENPTNNFADAGNTYYTGYLAAAKRLGISAGVGNNLFAPDKQITRQELFTLMYNSLKVIGQLPQGNTGKTLSGFADAGDIAPWAIDAMTLLVKTGTVGGSNGALTPLGTTTRAEMAQVLYNLLGK